MHFHASHILGLMLKDRPRVAEAYLVQLLRALHQVAIDGGQWDTGTLLLPTPDPIYRYQFGGTEEDLEVIAGYQDTIEKLRKQEWRPPGNTDHDKDKDKDKDRPPKGGKDDKGGKGAPKGGAGTQ